MFFNTTLTFISAALLATMATATMFPANGTVVQAIAGNTTTTLTIHYDNPHAKSNNKHIAFDAAKDFANPVYMKICTEDDWGGTCWTYGLEAIQCNEITGPGGFAPSYGPASNGFVCFYWTDSACSQTWPPGSSNPTTVLWPGVDNATPVQLNPSWPVWNSFMCY